MTQELVALVQAQQNGKINLVNTGGSRIGELFFLSLVIQDACYLFIF